MGRGEGADPGEGQGLLCLSGTGTVRFVKRQKYHLCKDNRNNQKYYFCRSFTQRFGADRKNPFSPIFPFPPHPTQVVPDR